ncbi:hypothetical protein NL676_032935 [Syzygium grande]|nr:hypothetical protein NL676_032935 [Syzygium grande]
MMAKRGSHCGAEGSATGLEEEGLGYKRISSQEMAPPLGMMGLVEPGSRGKSWCWILVKRVQMFDVRRHRKLKGRDIGSRKRSVNLHHYLTKKSCWNYGVKPWSCRTSGD